MHQHVSRRQAHESAHIASDGTHLNRPNDGRRMRLSASSRSSQAVSSFSQMTEEAYSFAVFLDLSTLQARVLILAELDSDRACETYF